MASHATLTSLSLGLMFCAQVAANSTAPGVTNKAPETQSCQHHFYGLPLLDNARLCQRFDADQPATLSYFSPASIDISLDFYLGHFGNEVNHKRVKGDHVLTFGRGVIVISKDNNGSQIVMRVYPQGQ